MTNYEKLCEKINIKLDFKYSIKGENNFHEKITILNCDKNSVIALFSGKKTNLRVVKASKQMNFTAEKQIELIKLIAADSDRTPLCLNQDQQKKWHCYCYQHNGEENLDFSEALAGLVLQLIETGELDKDEVRRILE